MNRRCGWKNRSVPTQGRARPGKREGAGGRTLSVSAAHCHLSRRARHWQAGPALLFAWARWGARCRALSEWAAAAGPTLSVSAAHCHLSQRARHWQAGQALLFAWVRSGARRRALSEWAAAAAVNRGSGARPFPTAKNFACPARPLPTRQWLSLRESCHRR